MSDDRLLKVPEVSERLGVNQDTIRRWLRQGKLRGAMLGGRSAGYRIAESELRRVEQEGIRENFRCHCGHAVAVPVRHEVVCNCGRRFGIYTDGGGQLHIWYPRGDQAPPLPEDLTPAGDGRRG